MTLGIISLRDNDEKKVNLVKLIKKIPYFGINAQKYIISEDIIPRDIADIILIYIWYMSEECQVVMEFIHQFEQLEVGSCGYNIYDIYFSNLYIKEGLRIFDGFIKDVEKIALEALGYHKKRLDKIKDMKKRKKMEASILLKKIVNERMRCEIEARSVIFYDKQEKIRNNVKQCMIKLNDVVNVKGVHIELDSCLTIRIISVPHELINLIERKFIHYNLHLNKANRWIVALTNKSIDVYSILAAYHKTLQDEAIDKWNRHIPPRDRLKNMRIEVMSKMNVDKILKNIDQI